MARLPLTHRVIFGAAAVADLKSIFRYVAINAGPDTADRYVDRIEAACGKLEHFPERGTPRDELRPGMRSIPFERRATIVYSISEKVVTIRRILHHGRNAADALR